MTQRIWCFLLLGLNKDNNYIGLWVFIDSLKAYRDNQQGLGFLP